MSYDVIVIGGGAAGLMASITAARNGASVVILEQNSQVGKKLSITGGGRCNILNNEPDVRLLLSHYGDANKYLFAAFSRFGVADTIAFFKDIGIPIVIEDRKRAFPVSQSAIDVVNALEKTALELGVSIHTRTKVVDIQSNSGALTTIITSKGSFTARSYILATGGRSRPETGSTGDGFTWLENLGHSIKQPSPNITPLAIKERAVQLVSGTTLQDVRATFSHGQNTKSFSIRGNILMTHFGISGPIILNNAYRVSELLEGGSDVLLHIDCYPDISTEELDARFRNILESNPLKSLFNTVKLIAPAGTTKLILALLPKDTIIPASISELPRATRLTIVSLLKSLPLTVTGLMGFERAVVADGGLSLDDIDTRTMNSKIISNLYITGDLLDINRPSGGYSLQLCWTTGYIAGLNAAQLAKQYSSSVL